jgi:thiol-disulfide isomerase/thioredoxin
MDARRWVWLLGLLLLSGCMALGSVATSEEIASTTAPKTAPTTAPTMTVIPDGDVTVEPVPTAEPDLLPEEPAPQGGEREFSTDFSRHTVPYDEILSGGPPKDGIPAVDEPLLHSVGAADAYIEDVEPVVLVTIEERVRAYPIQILTWHEIVNDVIGDVPVTVTFCPLCNTAIAFDRRFQDGDETLVLDFGTTGRLRYSNLIMYDRQTETWWQQATGEAIAGKFAGRQLDFVPANIIAWSEYKAAYPNGEVLSRATGFNRPYGNNPYAGYDDVNNSPFLYQGAETPRQLPPMARVLAVDLNGALVAYPYTTLAEQGVANDEAGGQAVVAMWQPGVASALDRGMIADSRDVGTVVVFSRELNGKTLTFRAAEGRIEDEDTGSVWDVFGRAIEGPLSGEQLTPVVGVNHFWFSWAAFRPDTRVYQPDDGTQGDAEPASGGADAAPASLQLTEDFEIVVYTGADDLGGERVMFSDLFAQGKPVLVEFWAGACPVCRRALPETQTAYLKHGDEVHFIGLDVGAYTGLGDETAARALYADLGLSFPTGTILDAAPMQVYRVTGMPTTLYFKSNGELFERGGGIVGADTLDDKLVALIAASE